SHWHTVGHLQSGLTQGSCAVAIARPSHRASISICSHRMLRLVQTDFAASGKRNHGERAPFFLMERRTADALLRQRCDLCCYIVAGEVELMAVVFAGRMNTELSRR